MPFHPNPMLMGSAIISILALIVGVGVLVAWAIDKWHGRT